MTAKAETLPCPAFLGLVELINIDQPQTRTGLENGNMSRIDKRVPKLRRAPQAPLSHPGATADADRAQSPSLDRPPGPDPDLIPGDRVQGLGNFGKLTDAFGTVERTNEDDAIVKWDNDGRARVRQPWLKKV
jgi:hypothetical protein